MGGAKDCKTPAVSCKAAKEVGGSVTGSEADFSVGSAVADALLLIWNWLLLETKVSGKFVRAVESSDVFSNSKVEGLKASTFAGELKDDKSSIILKKRNTH